VIQTAIDCFGGTLDDWRAIGPAAVHKDCAVNEAHVRFTGPAICRRGTFLGGVFRGGEFLGGVFHGGTFLGGTFRGGAFYGTPFQLAGACDYFVTIGRPGEVSVGCECYTPDVWRANIDKIAKKHGVNKEQQVRVLEAVALAEAWSARNPDIVQTAVQDQAREQ
jgi:hypothetical protein